MKPLRDNVYAMIDISTVIVIGIAFAALMVIAYLIWHLEGTFRSSFDGNSLNKSVNFTMRNITDGFDDAINLILVAVTVFILAIAISALLMLRGRRG